MIVGELSTDSNCVYPCGHRPRLPWSTKPDTRGCTCMNLPSPRAIGLACVATIALVAGCSSGEPYYTGGKVEDPERFITAVEKTWRFDTASGPLTRHAEGRCYFSAPKGSRDIEETAYCGPVRHYIDTAVGEGSGDGAAGDGVWDLYKFVSSEIKRGRATASTIPSRTASGRTSRRGTSSSGRTARSLLRMRPSSPDRSHRRQNQVSSEPLE